MFCNRNIIRQKGIAFVGSTMPAAILLKQIKLGEIEVIYVSHPRLKESYKKAIELVRNPIRIEDLSSRNKSFSTFRCLLVLLKAKCESKTINIYHECCWPSLDILIWIVRTQGFFMPQSDISFMYKTVPNINFLFKHKTFLKSIIYSIANLFFKIRYMMTENELIELFLSIRKYPSTILIEKKTEIKPRLNELIIPNERILLILSGIDYADNKEMIEIYRNVADLASSQGYRIAIKDHPNPDFRLNLVVTGAEILDPHIPIEILELNWSVVVSAASAGMAIFGCKAVSIVNLLSTMSNDDKQLRLNYLRSINPEARIAESLLDVFPKHQVT